MPSMRPSVSTTWPMRSAQTLLLLLEVTGKKRILMSA
jgi:hypothetical protein